MSVVGPNIVNTVDVSFRLPLMEAEDHAVQFETAVGLHEIFVPSTLLPIPHYELAFEVDGVHAWEKEHHNDPTKSKFEWAGHCHLAACASILFWPPPDEGVIHKGVTFSCEELKLLAAEFFGRWGGVSDVWGLENAAKTSALHERKPCLPTPIYDLKVGRASGCRR